MDKPQTTELGSIIHRLAAALVPFPMVADTMERRDAEERYSYVVQQLTAFADEMHRRAIEP